MFFEICDKKEMTPDNIDFSKPTIGLITLDELKKCADKFGFSSYTIHRCENENHHYRSAIDVCDDYIFTTLRTNRAQNKESYGALYIKKNLFLIVCDNDRDYFEEKIKYAEEKILKSAPSFGKVLLAFFESLVWGDSIKLEKLEEHINDIEDRILSKKADDNITSDLLSYRRRLLMLHNYYDELAQLFVCLYENENGIFEESDTALFKIFAGRVSHYAENVMTLREELNQIREAYQAMIDMKMNNIMKVFTVISAVFLPLTLITGWYGMNFSGMPELSWTFGYPLIIAISIVVVIACLLVFKFKRWL